MIFEAHFILLRTGMVENAFHFSQLYIPRMYSGFLHLATRCFSESFTVGGYAIEV